MFMSENMENENFTETAHDLRNVISGISTVNSLLGSKLHGRKDRETEDLIGYIDGLCRQGIDLINGIMPESVKPHEAGKDRRICSLNALVCSQAKLYGLQSYRKNITLTADLPEENICSLIHAAGIVRVMDNLFVNALKFTNRHGSIKISLSAWENNALLSFEDTGIGIPEELGEEIFKKYTSAKRTGTENEPSSGLGLYTSRRIVENHGGSLWFEAKRGGGTVFYVSLEKSACAF
jgi:signal transduction histidine kinase